MPKQKLFSEPELASVAKEFRLKSKKTKIEAAKELDVGRPAVQLAEENPEQSLIALRIRMIEKYSAYKVTGPFYILEKK